MLEAEVADDDRIEAPDARDIEARRLFARRLEQILRRIQGQIADE